MKALAAMVVMAALLAGAAGWAGAEESSATRPHRSTGIVVAISPTGLTMIEDHGRHRHVLGIDSTTRILLGAGTGVRGLGVGDYVAEECVPDGKGGLRAVKLVLYRPAWLDLASPEE